MTITLHANGLFALLGLILVLSGTTLSFYLMASQWRSLIAIISFSGGLVILTLAGFGVFS